MYPFGPVQSWAYVQVVKASAVTRRLDQLHTTGQVRVAVRHPCIKHYYKLIQVNTKLEKFLDASSLTLRPRGFFVAAWGSFSTGLPHTLGLKALKSAGNDRVHMLGQRSPLGGLVGRSDGVGEASGSRPDAEPWTTVGEV